MTTTGRVAELIARLQLQPLGDYAYVGATVGPGFDFADFSSLRDDAAASARLAVLRPDLCRLLRARCAP